MKALSVLPPYAAQIMSGRKVREYRPWQTHYRGRIWIHECGPKGRGIIGSVEIIGMECLGERAWAWVLRAPQRLAKPIVCRGWLGLWSPPAELRLPAC